MLESSMKFGISEIEKLDKAGLTVVRPQPSLNSSPCPFCTQRIPSVVQTLFGDSEESRATADLPGAHQANTVFYLRVSGQVITDADIQYKDILIVDYSIEPVDGKIVVANVNGEYLVTRFTRRKTSDGFITRYTGIPDYPFIYIHEGQSLVIVGVVISIIRTL